MSTRLPAVIFDFGNVIAFFDYSKACERYARPQGLTGPEFLQRLRDRGLMSVVHEYERGALTSRDFTRAVGRLAGIDLDHDEFAAAWADIFTLNAPVAALAASIKRRGYPVLLGSNTNELHAAQFRGQFARELEPFDALVLSYEVGHIKPSAGFYLACAAAAGREPGECIFIDDMPENVAGAREAGLRSVRYTEPSSLESELRALGIEIDGPTG